MVELLIYDRWGAQIGALSPITCTRAEEINGEDTLTFTTPVRLEKGDRALFQDDSGEWHEHVVTEAEELRETADVLCTYVADNSLCETMGDYLEDVRNQNMTAAGALAKALARWGRPDGKGGKAHVFGEVEFSECEDARELLALTKAELPKRTQPQVSYEATVQDLYAAGYPFEGFQLGDDVQIIDWSFAPALELSGRILRIEWNYRDPSQTVITLGNITPAITEQVNRQAAALQTLRDHAGAWDKAAAADQSYINSVIGVINDVMNATGGYVYMEPGEGITVYDRPVDQNPTMAIQLKGAGFRIANKRVGNTWQWRTFGTGDGFTADEINAGVIRGGSNYWNLATGDLLFKQGQIADTAGRNVWNLNTGSLTTRYMKAYSIDATGKFSCGSAAQLLTVQSGQIQGSESGEQFAFIDFSGHSYNIDTGAQYKGMQMQAKHTIRISTPQIAVSPSSDTTVTATITKTGEQQYISEIHDNGNGSIGWTRRTMRFINGFCTVT